MQTPPIITKTAAEPKLAVGEKHIIFFGLSPKLSGRQNKYTHLKAFRRLSRKR
jgi:hypothetical protein